MKERPIIFTSESVHAILAGRKTQTRRIVKPQFGGEPEKDWLLANGGFEKSTILRLDQWGNEIGSLAVCSHGKPGDRLWVKETWAEIPDDDGTLIYRADDPEDNWKLESGVKWKSPRFMPRSVSRIVLEVTGIRVERLQEITEADALAEGVEPTVFTQDDVDWAISDAPEDELLRALGPGQITARFNFQMLWDQINGKRASWESNPWVWVIEFSIVNPGKSC